MKYIVSQHYCTAQPSNFTVPHLTFSASTLPHTLSSSQHLHTPPHTKNRFLIYLLHPVCSGKYHDHAVVLGFKPMPNGSKGPAEITGESVRCMCVLCIHSYCCLLSISTSRFISTRLSLLLPSFLPSCPYPCPYRCFYPYPYPRAH